MNDLSRCFSGVPVEQDCRLPLPQNEALCLPKEHNRRYANVYIAKQKKKTGRYDPFLSTT